MAAGILRVMGYRDDLQAARMRRDALARELEEMEERLAARRALDEKVARLRRELAAAEENIAQARARTSLPLLERVSVNSPCPERWEAMEGDDQVRFCRRCEKNVYDLSALDADQAEALLRERGESMCVTFYRRPDGTILTQECIGGTRRRARRRQGVAAAAVLAAGLGFAALNHAPVTPRRTVGELVTRPSIPSSQLLAIHERMTALMTEMERLENERTAMGDAASSTSGDLLEIHQRMTAITAELETLQNQRARLGEYQRGLLEAMSPPGERKR